jgi:SAM-dependent methyltransferase
MISHEIAVPDFVYPYLVQQRGALDDMKDDRALWLGKYAEMLASEFRSIEPFLPKRCDTILDIGGGMGGINILLNRHYGGGCSVSLLDGVDDLPQMTNHAETFSNFDIARNFLQLNGVERIHAIRPEAPRAPHFYDLVISLKSWCFHYPPSRYIDFVKSCSIKGQTQIIVDVRGGAKGNPGIAFAYQRELSKAFSSPMRVHWGIKFETMSYTA